MKNVSLVGSRGAKRGIGKGGKEGGGGADWQQCRRGGDFAPPISRAPGGGLLNLKKGGGSGPSEVRKTKVVPVGLSGVKGETQRLL